jgi:hypothetical protein
MAEEVGTRLGWGVLFSLLVAPMASAAPAPVVEDAPESVTIAYANAAGCPEEAAFLGQVTARIRRSVVWVKSGGSVRIVTTLSQESRGATGQLEVERVETAPTRREFTAETCEEVAAALALVVALTLDPNARTEPLPATPPPPAPASPEEPAAPPSVVTPLPPPSPRAPATLPTRPPAPPPPSSPLRYVAWFGPVVGADAGYAPEALVTLGLSGGARLVWGARLSSALQLTPLWGKTGTTGPAVDLGRFGWSLARVEACPVEVRLTPVLTFSPCLAGEVGRLAARGEATSVVPTAVDRWWAAPGLTAALHLDLADWFVRLSGEGLFPVIRDEFVFRNPDLSVHRPSAFAYGARLGVGFQLGQ